MAINNTNTPAPSVKKYVDYANQQVDEQAILDKYNAATLAQFNIQREQNRQAENQFYNQMYNTQKTAMDTIRQSNAAAVSTGASRGVQAANELSSLLGLQSESIASATELAQANRQTAQEETAAVLENVLNAYQQAQQERSQLVSQSIEAASVDAQQAANQVAATDAQTKYAEYLRNLHASDPAAYYREVAKDNAATDFANMTNEQYNNNIAYANSAIDEVTTKLGYNANDTSVFDFGEKGSEKANKIRSDLYNIYTAYGLTTEQADKVLNNLFNEAKNAYDKNGAFMGSKAAEQAMNQAANNYIRAQFALAYAAKRSEQTKQ